MATIIFHDLTPKQEPNPQPDPTQDKPDPNIDGQGKIDEKQEVINLLLNFLDKRSKRYEEKINSYKSDLFKGQRSKFRMLTFVGKLFASVIIVLMLGLFYYTLYTRENLKPYFTDKAGVRWGMVKAYFSYDHIDFESDSKFRENYRVSDKGKQGLISPQGDVIIPIEYDSLASVGGGLITTKLNERWGFLSFDGNVAIPFTYQNTHSFTTFKFAPVKRDNKWGCINQNNQCIISFQYDDVWAYNKKLFGVKQGDKWGFINDKERLILPYQYDNIVRTGLDLVETQIGDKYGLVNAQGKEVIPPQYDWINAFLSSDYSTMELNNKWGIINSEGRVILPPTYDVARRFSSDLAAVSINGRWGFVNVEGKEVIPIKYDEVENFDRSTSKARVRLGKEWFTIDKQGRRVEE